MSVYLMVICNILQPFGISYFQLDYIVVIWWLHDDISNEDISNEHLPNEDISKIDISNKNISNINIG
jgi:hypothetical protein